MVRDLGCLAMNREEIREVVRITIDELMSANAVNDPYPIIKRDVEKKLRDYFNSNKNGTGIGYVLNQLSDDDYIDLIYLQYRDNKTLEFVAEYYDRDVTTISRNKKRLILEIYKQLQMK